MRHWITGMIGASALAASSLAMASEVIVETRPVASWTPAAAARPVASASDRWLELQEQMDTMQRDLNAFRGWVEETQHQLEQLTATQQQLYDSLDSRITEMSQQVSQLLASPMPLSDNGGVDQVAPEDNTWLPLSEKALYEQAYDALHARKYTEALDAFQAYLTQYPDGEHRPNAHYWLGEIYLIGGDSEAADTAFSTVVSDFPSHQKASDSLLKRGYVAYARQEWTQAEAYFNDVRVRFPGSPAARIAEARLIQLKQDVQ